MHLYRKMVTGWKIYALYMAIKDALGGISWSEWPAELKDREEAALNQKREELAEEIDILQIPAVYVPETVESTEGIRK